MSILASIRVPEVVGRERDGGVLSHVPGVHRRSPAKTRFEVRRCCRGGDAGFAFQLSMEAGQVSHYGETDTKAEADAQTEHSFTVTYSPEVAVQIAYHQPLG